MGVNVRGRGEDDEMGRGRGEDDEMGRAQPGSVYPAK